MYESAPASMTPAIAGELRALLQHHGCDQDTSEQLCALPAAEGMARIYEMLEVLGARPHLLAVIAGHGVSLDDEATLELLRFARPDSPGARLHPLDNERLMDARR